MGVSSVTHFGAIFFLEFLVFIGGVGGFLPIIPSLTLLTLIPHTFHWKNVTFFARFVQKVTDGVRDGGEKSVINI